MRKMKRLLAVLMAVLLVTGSLQVSVFAGQAGVPGQVPETVAEAAGNAAEALEEDGLSAEEDALSAEEEASEGGEESAAAGETSGDEDETAGVQEESEEDPEEQGPAAEEDISGDEQEDPVDSQEVSEETEDTSGEEEIFGDGQSSEDVQEASGDGEEASEDAEVVSGDAEEASGDDAFGDGISDDGNSGDGISGDEISDDGISGTGEEASEDEAETDVNADGQEPAAGTEDDAAAEDSGEAAVTEDGAGETGVPGELPLIEEDGMTELVSEDAVEAGGAAISVDTHSQSEIRDFIRDHPSPQVDNTFAVMPSAKSPYVAGELSDESKEYAFNALNQMRYIAGVPADVTEKAEYTEKAQAASLVDAANDSLSHYPAQPSDMDDALYQLGYAGAQSSNLAWGVWSIAESVFLWMSDSDSSNIDRVGHRRWIINPAMKYAGFGAANKYSAVYAFDSSRSSSSYYGVAWPAQNMPLEYFNDDDAWSVSFGMELTESAVSVNLKRTGDGREWSFSSGDQSDGFFNVENSNYGQTGCVIFRPDGISYSAGDQFTVTLSGVGSAPVTYTVDFFAICSGSHDYETLRVVEPTCTWRGVTTHVCKDCGDVQYSYTAANGHDYRQTGEMQDGLVTMTCETCGDVKTGSVPSSFTPYWRKGYSYYYPSVPSGVEKGDTLNYWILEQGITYTAESDVHFDDFVVEVDGPEGCEVTRESETEGSLFFGEAGSYHLRIYPKYNPGVVRTAEIRVVKPLESVTLMVSGSQQQQYRYGDRIPLRAVADGGKGTLKYTLYVLKDDGTETAISTVDSTSATGTFVPKSAGLHRLRMDVKDTGDGDRIVSSNVLELDIQKGRVIVKNGNTVSAAGPLTYGQPLSELTINNAVFVSSGSTGSGTELSGTFAFNTPDEILPVGTHTVGWTFTPEDENYETYSSTLKVTVNKAVPVVTDGPSAEAVVYHPQRKLGDVTLTGGEVSVPGSWQWTDAETALQVPGGTYACRFVPEDTRNYESVDAEAEVTVSRAVPSIASLQAGNITYGQTLADSQLAGAAQYSSSDETPVSGTFQWGDGTAKPAVSDSLHTEYPVIFTPDDTENYEEVTLESQVRVEKAEHPEEMPPAEIGVSFSTETVSDQILRDKEIEKWSFAEEELGRALEAGEAVVLTVVYTGEDAGNYETESAEITVTRSTCEHNGERIIRNAKEPTCTETGSTGDVYCSLCGELVESGTVISAKGHSWSEEFVVVREAACTEAGSKKKSCTVCGEEITEEIPAAGHSWNTDYTVDREATCTEEGSESIHCAVCGEIREGTARAIEKTAHTYGAWETVTAASCTETGSRKKVCTACGEEVVEEIPAKGHSWDDGAVTQEPTLEEEGARTFTCTACGEQRTESIAKLIDIGNAQVLDFDEEIAYSGASVLQTPTVVLDDVELTEGTDYTVSYSGNTAVGTARMIIIGTGLYGGSIVKEYKITAGQADVLGFTVTGIKNKTYTGSRITQSPVVKIGSITLKEGTDYTLSYVNNLNVGTAKMTITFLGNFSGTLTFTFKIVAASIANATVTGIVAKTYTGKKLTQAPVVKVGGKTLKAGTDYVRSYENNLNAGTATITMTGQGNYKGTISKTFKIKPLSLEGAEVTRVVAKVWTGRLQTQSPIVKLDSKTLKLGRDYKLVYTNNRAVGTATMGVKGTGNYTGTVKKTFRINPKGTSMSRVYPGVRRFVATWIEQSTQTTGYQLQYSLNSLFASGNKTITIPSNKTLKRKVTGLTAGRTYFIRVRTYKTVDGKNYYSEWSQPGFAKPGK